MALEGSAQTNSTNLLPTPDSSLCHTKNKIVVEDIVISWVSVQGTKDSIV